MRFRRHVSLGFLPLGPLGLLAVVAERCLEDAIAPSERRNLSNTEGESYPLGIWVNQWASGELTAAMAQILIQEKLGFHVLIGKGSATSAQLFAMAGCKTPTDWKDRGCEPAPKQTYFHVGMEGWSLVNPIPWDTLRRDLPATAPVNLGHIGYDGISGEYTFSAALHRAYEAEGLYLEFYRSYNVSVHNPGLYFDRISAVNTSDLKPCAETPLSNPASMQNYLVATGDADGVELVNGTVRGKCFEEYFWLPPACRLETSKCFLFLTTFGYGVEVMMQKATIFYMPVVPVDVKDWNKYANLAAEVSSLFYWWEPDPTFIGFNVKMISFPHHNSTAWEQGIFVSATQSIRLDKYGSQDLEVLAPTVRELIGAFSLKMDALNQLLLHQKIHGTSAIEEACAWLKGHRDIWEEWLPDTTKCFPQFGLFNEATEVFVESREGDSNLICKACPSGSFSRPLRDGQGLTSVCVSCAPGSVQSSGAATACEPCPLGEHQEDFGAASCNRCTVGSYQNVTGQSLCKTCPEKRTTLGLGAESLVECVCKAGLIEMDGQCVPCIKGLSCPIGSTVEGLLIATLPVNDSDAGVQRPFLLQGYNSHPAAPLTIYQCRDHCPGGSPGSCSDGRVGPTCAECPSGSFAALGRCAPCAEGNQALWMIGVAVLLFLGIFPAYVLLTQPYSPKTQLGGITASILGLLVNLVQNLLVISTAPTSWPELMLVMSNVLNVVTLNPELLGVACVGDVLTVYLLRALVFPAVVGILLATFAFSRLLPSAFERLQRLQRLRKWPFVLRLFERWPWHGTACVIGKFCQVTFPTMANVGLSPMMCYRHPGSQMHSVVNYSNTFCGSSDHVLMLTAGAALLSFTAGFLVFCIWAGRRAPRLSLEGQAAVKFLFEEFRPDMAWFGVVTLSRGLFLSLPSVMVPNRPNIQLVMMHSVMLFSLVFQGYCQPWKAPALNLVDAISQSLFLTLLGVGLGGLEQSEAAVDVLMTLGTFVCICLLLVFGLALLTFGAALILEKFFARGVLGRRCASLGSVPESGLIVFLLHNLARSIKRTASHRTTLTSAVDQLGTHDARMILMSLTILEMEMGLPSTRSSSIILPGADGEFVKQLSEISEPYRIAGAVSFRDGGARTAVARRRMSCEAAAFRGRLNFSLSGLSQESLDHAAGSFSPVDDFCKAQEFLDKEYLAQVREEMVKAEF